MDDSFLSGSSNREYYPPRSPSKTITASPFLVIRNYRESTTKAYWNNNKRDTLIGVLYSV